MKNELITSSAIQKNNKIKNTKYYEKKKRKAKIDYCNICGKLLPLTWDHVPPKFCFNNGNVKYNSMMEFHKDNYKKEYSPNGIKYRTICADCNNRILGAAYDREYKKLVDILYSLYTSKEKLSQYITIKELKINQIARAIVGHLLAAREDYVTGKIEEELRHFLLDETALPPKDLKLLYYSYPYNTVMIVRDVFPFKFDKNEYKAPNCLISCINSFPLAFILASDCNDTCGLYDMFELCTQNINDEVDIKIDLLSYLFPNHKESRHPFWPCNVSDEKTGVSLILTSETGCNDSILITNRNIKKDSTIQIKKL